MTILYLLLLSVVCGCLYRMGGCGPADLQKEWGWVPGFIRNFPKKRDVGCGVVTLGATLLIMPALTGWWIMMYLLAFGLLWASLSTYWDKLFGYDNHWFHGFMIGISVLAVSYANPWVTLIYAGTLAVLMGAWSLLLGNATWEEAGRGFFMPIALAVYLFI